MRGRLADQLRETLHQIEAAGLTKRERVLATPQSARIRTLTADGPREALNFCANNYLGLADHPDVLAAARDSYDRWGFGMASVRFICGTQQPHIELEAALAGCRYEPAALQERLNDLNINDYFINLTTAGLLDLLY